MPSVEHIRGSGVSGVGTGHLRTISNRRRPVIPHSAQASRSAARAFAFTTSGSPEMLRGWRGRAHPRRSGGPIPRSENSAGEEGPVESILKRARSQTFAAMESGWSGPPYDPLEAGRAIRRRSDSDRRGRGRATGPSQGARADRVQPQSQSRAGPFFDRPRARVTSPFPTRPRRSATALTARTPRRMPGRSSCCAISPLRSCSCLPGAFRSWPRRSPSSI